MPFWSKDQQARIDETVTFVVSKLPPAEQTPVRTFINNHIATAYASPAAQKGLSDLMSVKAAGADGNKDVRAARRALVLIKSLINPANPKAMTSQQVMALPAGQVMATYADSMPGFRLFALQEQNVNTLLQQHLNDLKAAPELFLSKHIVMTQSQNTANGVGAASPHTFLYDFRSQSFIVLFPGMNRPAHLRGNGLTVPMVNVPEVLWGRVQSKLVHGAPSAAGGNFSQIPATTLTGSDLMITSAFSGCSFCYKTNGSGTYAAHIGPDGTASNAGFGSIGPAPTLAMQLGGPHGTAQFSSPAAAAQGAVKVFGRGYSNVAGFPTGYAVNPSPGVPLLLNSMYLFGIQSGGTWSFYCQENQNGISRVSKLN